jgi:hypothetical protein
MIDWIEIRIVEGYRMEVGIFRIQRGGNDHDSCWCSHLEPDVEHRMEKPNDYILRSKREGSADEKDDGRCIKNGAKWVTVG